MRSSRILVALLVQLWVAVVLSRPTGYAAAPVVAASTPLPYAKYDTTTFVIFVKDIVTGEVWNSTYYPRVDEFSQLVVTESFDLNNQTNFTVWIEHPISGYKLEPKRFYGQSNDTNGDWLLVPYFTVMMLLDKGNVTGMKWDDGCHDCKDSECLDIQCANKRFNKDGSDICTQVDCDIKMFVTWTGRDKHDSACTSIASAPSAFSKYSTTPITKVGDGLWDDFIYKFTTNAPNPITGEYD